MSSLPSYVAAAKPVPAASRAAWYKNVAPTYAGIMLWFVFWQKIAVGGDAKPAGGVLSQGLGTALLGLLLAALICHFFFYLVPGLLGMKTGLPLYVVGTSTYGVTGGLFMPGFLMGLLQFGWLGVNAYAVAVLLCQCFGIGASGPLWHPSLAPRGPCDRLRRDLRLCRTEGHSIRGQGGHVFAADSPGGAHSVGGEDGGRNRHISA